MATLVSGASGGLGRFLYERTGDIGFTREDSVTKFINPNQSYDMIVHCAFNMNRIENQNDLAQYLEDSVFLTNALTTIPHDLFILISTIDVYPKNGECHKESEIINPNLLSGLYSTIKLACESIVRSRCTQFLILRPGMLLGPYMRPNNITRLVLGHPGKITLSHKSLYHLSLYEDVLDVVDYARTHSLTGIYNLVRSPQISLKMLAEKYAPNVKFGNYTYAPDPVSNKKVSKILPSVVGTSMEALENFVTRDIV